ncbi:Protein polybromo-1 [Spathaspora sp. JA1]|nr:Protein polybromo-1 [Spathaspora sp. JA1]
MAPKRKAGSSSTSSSKKTKPNAGHSVEDYKQFFQSTLNLVMNLQESDSEDQMAFPFVKLPSKKLYPDYYQIIAQPISLTDVQKKIKSNGYSSSDDFLSDFQLLLDNAIKYNNSDSWIVINATKIFNFVNDQVKEFEQSASVKVEEPEHHPKIKLKLKKKPDTKEEEQPEVSNSDLPELCTAILNDVIDHEFEDEGAISAPFIEDVDTDYYSDYLDFVAKPMSFNKVINLIEKKKLFNSKSSVSDNLQKFYETTTLIFNNARLYNDESSQIHQDANMLQEYFDGKYNQLKKQVEDTAKPKLKIRIHKHEPESPKKTKKKKPEPKVEQQEAAVEPEEPEVKTEPEKKESKQIIVESSIHNTLGKTLPLLPPTSSIIQETSIFSSVPVSSQIAQYVQQKTIANNLLPLSRNQDVKKSLFPTQPLHSMATIFEYKVPANGYTTQSYTVALPNDISPFVSFKASLHNLLYEVKREDLVNGHGYLNSTSDEEFQCKLFVNDEEVPNASDCFEEKRRENDNDDVLGVQYDVKLSYGLNVLSFECKVAPHLSKQIKPTIVAEPNEEIAGRHTRHQLQQMKMSWDVEKITFYVVCNNA